VNNPADIETDPAAERRLEIARVAKELAGYGFYVMDALLPDDLRARPELSRRPEKATQRLTTAQDSRPAGSGKWRSLRVG